MEKQKTICKSVSITGRGLHSGKDVQVLFHPASEDSGITFRRVDIPGCPTVRALVSRVHDTSRGTSLREGDADVMTVEHLMAALAGLEIDNLRVDINDRELPIMDGSAQPYTHLLQTAGILEQNREKNYLVIDRDISFTLPEKEISLSISPYNGFKVEVEVDYGTSVLDKQEAVMEDISEFIPHIHDARTFVFLHELLFLVNHGLVKGGDLDNAVVFVDKMPSREDLEQLAIFFNKKSIDITSCGTLNHTPVRYPNEPAKHKLLDLVGDLYLLGRPIKGIVRAKKTGHWANTEFGKKINEIYHLF
ncbi:MAG: UDP-3-O-acyl-N-acetylglucosamine deacetylase [Bacteroidales bacterium]|jgi:UDP-3-O-[3-hydroxymyristoyl] N-acetylglucosamine deacetylase/3-hydroxyacyl-[acyl-carrier-protein] dehydratase|nr:UDP-3-O-acyl-N-acetylglucosamine deacetylase [Bacteroidales bacterium]